MSSNKPKKTPWFDAMAAKPKRKGLYEYKDVQLSQTVYDAYWDGFFWYMGPLRLQPTPGDQWRGLTEPWVFVLKKA